MKALTCLLIATVYLAPTFTPKTRQRLGIAFVVAAMLFHICRLLK